MKLRKQIKNRVVAVAMLAVVLLYSIPNIARADVLTPDQFSGGNYFVEKGLVDGLQRTWDRYFTWQSKDGAKIFLCSTKSMRSDGKEVYSFYVASTSDFDISEVGQYENEKNNWTSAMASRTFICPDYGKIYYYIFYPSSGRESVVHTAHYINSEKLAESRDNGEFTCKNTTLHAVACIVTGNDTKKPWYGKCEMGVEGSPDIEGSENNPIKKDDFGYPQIYNSTYIHNDPNNLETLDKLYSGQDFQWKKKTTTGFDLTNNDYNYTYIECKVKANYQYNDKFSGKGSWHNFDSYGEMGNLGKVRAESLSHYYTFQEFQEALPITSNELPDHKMRAIKSSAVYYFRVVCMKTNSTVVIPNEKDCKYYVGPWRSVTVTKINGKDGSSVVEDGEFDENGEWKKDDDSGDNGKDIDNGSAEGDDLSDASDKAHETINSNANKSTLDLDSAKAFINQVADVPKMIADIFSFLPDWVKYSFAFGFALIPILIIFKLIRG